jgi:hypothetical protein
MQRAESMRRRSARRDRTFVLVGVAANRVDLAWKAIRDNANVKIAELRVMRDLVDNDLRALWAFQPDASDLDLFSYYLDSRGILSSAREQLDAAIDAIRENPTDRDLVQAEVCKSFEGFAGHSLGTFRATKKHLNADLPEDIR